MADSLTPRPGSIVPGIAGVLSLLRWPAFYSPCEWSFFLCPHWRRRQLPRRSSPSSSPQLVLGSFIDTRPRHDCALPLLALSSYHASNVLSSPWGSKHAQPKISWFPSPFNAGRRRGLGAKPGCKEV